MFDFDGCVDLQNFFSFKEDIPLWKSKYLLLFLIFIIILFGLSKLSFSEKTSEKVSLIQGNVDQNLR